MTPKSYDLKRPKGQGSRYKHRAEVARTVLLPPKHEKILTDLMDGRGLVNVSDFFRRLLEEESARQSSRSAIFAALDRIKVRRAVRASDVQAIIKALDWNTED